MKRSCVRIWVDGVLEFARAVVLQRAKNFQWPWSEISKANNWMLFGGFSTEEHSFHIFNKLNIKITPSTMPCKYASTF